MKHELRVIIAQEAAASSMCRLPTVTPAAAGEPTDIFPNINIPVIAVAWQYTGLNPEETEGRITSAYERTLTTTVDNIEHIESTTLNGQALVKIFLQPTASLDTATLPSHKQFCAFCRRAPCLRQSSITAHRAYRFCSWDLPVRDFANNS
jgi:hypothetical protein